jgi:hypothetical protein
MNNNYYIDSIILENCPYSIKAENLLKKHNIPINIITVDHDNKHKYKTSQINSFPQLYLKNKLKKDSLLLGGYDDLNYVFTKFKNKQITNENITQFMNKYKWAKKPTLRLIQLINNNIYE